ncbi:Uncharacterised protein [Vibrio cholerae]|nr:Uncharacterised protein [Vibrio cholerae]
MAFCRAAQSALACALECYPRFSGLRFHWYVLRQSQKLYFPPDPANLQRCALEDRIPHRQSHWQHRSDYAPKPVRPQSPHRH